MVVVSIYFWGASGFMGSLFFLVMLPGRPFLLVVASLVYKSMNKEKYSEDRFKFGKICEKCNERAMNVARACPKCKGPLSNRQG